MINVSFTTSQVDFNVGMEGSAEFAASMEGHTDVPASDHAVLRNRDAAAQHPIEAISGLREELADMEIDLLELTNAEILAMWNNIID